MKTIIQFNDSGVPIGIIQYADATEPILLQSNEVEVSLDIPTDFEKLHKQWRRLSTGLFVDVGPAPSKWHDWDISTNKWDINLVRAKDELWKLAKQVRQGSQYEPLSTPFGLFDGDAASQKAIADSLTFLKSLVERGGFNLVTYTRADNTETYLGIAELEEILFLFGERAQRTHNKFQAVRRTIDDSSSIDELESLHEIITAANKQPTSRS